MYRSKRESCVEPKASVRWTRLSTSEVKHVDARRRRSDPASGTLHVPGTDRKATRRPLAGSSRSTLQSRSCCGAFAVGVGDPAGQPSATAGFASDGTESFAHGEQPGARGSQFYCQWECPSMRAGGFVLILALRVGASANCGLTSPSTLSEQLDGVIDGQR